MKKLLLLSALVGLTVTSAFAQSTFTIFDGTAFQHDFGTAGTIDNGEGNAAPSLHLQLGTAWGSSTFYANNAAFRIAPEEINWSQGDLQFDYMIPSGSTGTLSTVVLRIFAGGGHVSSAQYTPNTALTADGAWHTFTAPISDWSAAYYTAVGNSTIDPSTTTDLRITLQGTGSAGGLPNIYVDNFTVPVPEPSTYAAIAGALALGLAFWRRRK